MVSGKKADKLAPRGMVGQGNVRRETEMDRRHIHYQVERVNACKRQDMRKVT